MSFNNPSSISSLLLQSVVLNQWLVKPIGSIPKEIGVEEFKTTPDGYIPILVKEEETAIRLRMKKILKLSLPNLTAEHRLKLKNLRQIYLNPNFNSLNILRFKFGFWFKKLYQMYEEKNLNFSFENPYLFKELFFQLNFTFYKLDYYRKTDRKEFSNNIGMIKGLIEQVDIKNTDPDSVLAVNELKEWINFFDDALGDSETLLPCLLIPNTEFGIKIAKHPELKTDIIQKYISSLSELITAIMFNIQFFAKNFNCNTEFWKKKFSQANIKHLSKLHSHLSTFVNDMLKLQITFFSEDLLNKIAKIFTYQYQETKKIEKELKKLNEIKDFYIKFRQINNNFFSCKNHFEEIIKKTRLVDFQVYNEQNFLLETHSELTNLYSNSLFYLVNDTRDRLNYRSEVIKELRKIKKMTKHHASSAYISSIDGIFYDLLTHWEQIKLKFPTLISENQFLNSYHMCLFTLWKNLKNWKHQKDSLQIFTEFFNRINKSYNSMQIDCEEEIYKIDKVLLFQALDKVYKGKNLIHQEIWRETLIELSVPKGLSTDLDGTHRQIFLDFLKLSITSLKGSSFQSVKSVFLQIEQLANDWSQLEKKYPDTHEFKVFRNVFFSEVMQSFDQFLMNRANNFDKYHEEAVKKLELIHLHLQNNNIDCFLEELYKWADYFAKIQQITWDSELIMYEFTAQYKADLRRPQQVFDQIKDSDLKFVCRPLMEKAIHLREKFFHCIDDFGAIFINNIPTLNAPLIRYLEFQDLCKTEKKIPKNFSKSSILKASIFSKKRNEKKFVEDEENLSETSSLDLNENYPSSIFELNQNEKIIMELRELLDTLSLNEERTCSIKHSFAFLSELYTLEIIDLSYVLLLRSKAVLFWEQTLKAQIEFYNPALLLERLPIEFGGKVIRSTHDLRGLIHVCKQNSISIPAMSEEEKIVIFACNKVVSQESRYPFLDYSYPIYDLLLKEPNEALQEKIKQQVKVILNLSAQVWRSFESKKSLQVVEEKPTLISNLNFSYNPYQNLLLIEELVDHLRKVKLRFLCHPVLEERPSFGKNPKREKTFWSALQNIEGALILLQGMNQSHFDASIAFSRADAELLNAAVVLEQSSLLIMAFYPILDLESERHVLDKQIENSNEKRSWAYSHRLDQFIECLNAYFSDRSIEKINISKELLEEISDFLAVTHHYSTLHSSTHLSTILNQIKKWSSIKHSYMNKKTFNWCQHHLGLRPHWEEKIDQHLLHLFHCEVQPKIKIILETTKHLLTLLLKNKV